MDTTPDAAAGQQQPLQSQQQPAAGTATENVGITGRMPLLQTPPAAQPLYQQSPVPGQVPLMQNLPTTQPPSQPVQVQQSQQVQQQSQAQPQQRAEGDGTGQRRRRRKRGFAAATAAGGDQAGTTLPRPGDTAKMQLRAMAQQAGVWQPWKLTPPDRLPTLNDAQKDRLDAALQYTLQINLAHQEAVKQQRKEASDSLSRQELISILSRIYVGNLSREVTEDLLLQSFSKFGGIWDCQRKSEVTPTSYKGYAFLHFDSPEAAMLALTEMRGFPLGGRNIIVGRPKNTEKSVEYLEPLAMEAASANRVYVASLHPDLTEDDVRTVFEAFGTIKRLFLMPGWLGRGKHKGYGWIEYEDASALSAVMMCGANFELAGQLVQMCRALSTPDEVVAMLKEKGKYLEPTADGKPPPEVLAAQQAQRTAGIVPTTTTAAAPATSMTTAPISAMPGASAGSTLGAMRPQTTAASGSAAAQQVSQLPENLAREENLTIRGSQRYMIMQKLQRGDTTDTENSTVVQLSNMVTAKDVDDTLEEEIGMECIKHGAVEKIHIQPDLRPGQSKPHPDSLVKIYVKFSSPTSTSSAIDALNGRYFDGRVVTAERFSEKAFRKLAGLPEEGQGQDNKEGQPQNNKGQQATGAV